MPAPADLRKVRTTNALAELLLRGGAAGLAASEIEEAASLKVCADPDGYEEKEKGIPELIREVLEEECGPFTRLAKRCFFEDDAWLVRVGCREGERLCDHGHEVLTRTVGGGLLPAMVEGREASMHLVRIRVPRIFVSTVVLPMAPQTMHRGR